jgi:hypothetical protein
MLKDEIIDVRVLLRIEIWPGPVTISIVGLKSPDVLLVKRMESAISVEEASISKRS